MVVPEWLYGILKKLGLARDPQKESARKQADREQQLRDARDQIAAYFRSEKRLAEQIARLKDQKVLKPEDKYTLKNLESSRKDVRNRIGLLQTLIESIERTQSGDEYEKLRIEQVSWLGGVAKANEMGEMAKEVNAVSNATLAEGNLTIDNDLFDDPVPTGTETSSTTIAPTVSPANPANPAGPAGPAGPATPDRPEDSDSGEASATIA